MKKILFASFLGVAVILSMAAASRRAIFVEGNTQILSGTVITTTDGTVTGTFSTVFSAVPKVIVSQRGETLPATTNTFTSITTSNFVFKNNKASVSNEWIAIGTP